MSSIGSLVVDLIANTASWNANIEKAAAQLNSNAAKMNRALQTITHGVESVKRGLETLGVGLGATELVEAAKRGLEYAASLGETAQQLGVTSKQLQEYRFAASQTGVSQEALEKGLAKLNATLGQAKLGAKGPQKEFAALSKIIGVDVVASSHSAGDALPKLADAFSKVGESSQRAAAERLAFGRGGQQLDTLLTEGSKGLDDYAQAFERLGLVLSSKQIEAAHDASIKLSALKTVIGVSIASVVADNAGSVVKLANAIERLVGAARNAANASPAIQAVLDAASHAINPLGNAASLVGNYLDPGTPVDQFKAARQRLSSANAAFDRTKAGGGDPQAILDASQRLHAAAANYRAAAASFATDIKIRARAAAPAPADDSLDHFLASDGHSKLQPKEFINQSAQLDLQLLRIKQQMATDTDAVAAFVKQQIDIESNKTDADIAENVSQGHITAAQGKILLSKSAELRAAEMLQAENERLSQKAQDALNIQLGSIDTQKELLQAQESLALTGASRHAIALNLLALDQREERLKLSKIIADEKLGKASKAEAEIAQQRLDALDKVYSTRAASTGAPAAVASAFNQLSDQARISLGDLSVIKSSVDMRERMQAIVAKTNELLGLGLNLDDDQAKSILKAVDATTQLNQKVKLLQDSWDEVKTTGDNIIDKLTDIDAWKKPGDILKGIVHDLAQEAVKLNVANPIKNALFGENLPTGASVKNVLTGGRASIDAAVAKVSVALDALAAKLNAFQPGSNGFLNFPSGSIANDNGFLSGLSDNGASIGIDPSELESVSANLNVMTGATAQATAALQAQVPALGQFGSGLEQVLASLASGGGGGGGFLGGLLKIGGAIAGGIGGGMSVSEFGSATIGGSLDKLGMIPIKFAAGGGEIDGPTLVGERGTEMLIGRGSVIPAPQTAAFRRDLAAVRGKGGGDYNQRPIEAHFHFHGNMSEKERRQSSAQAMSALRQEMGRAARTGIGG